jgi:hypothetical protein
VPGRSIIELNGQQKMDSEIARIVNAEGFAHCAWATVLRRHDSPVAETVVADQLDPTTLFAHYGIDGSDSSSVINGRATPHLPFVTRRRSSMVRSTLTGLACHILVPVAALPTDGSIAEAPKAIVALSSVATPSPSVAACAATCPDTSACSACRRPSSSRKGHSPAPDANGVTTRSRQSGRG